MAAIPGPPPEGWRPWPERGRGGTGEILVLAVLVALWVGSRTVTWSLVFPWPGEVRLVGGDAYFHLRHARYATEHFPRLLRWDPGSGYPRGERSYNTGAYHLVLAGAALAAGRGQPSPLLVNQVVAWSPVALGVLTLLALYGLGRTLAGPFCGLAAVAALLAAPGASQAYTLLGYADHHVLEMLLAVLTVAGLVGCLRFRPGERLGWRPLLWALPLALFQFSWAGASLHVLTAGLALAAGALALWLRKDPEGLAALARATSAYGLALGLLYVPVTTLFPTFVLNELNHRPVLLGAAGLALGLPALALAARGARWPRRPAERWAGLAFLAASAALAGAWLRSDEGAWLVENLTYTRTAFIAEHVPVDLALVAHHFGPFLALAALGTAWSAAAVLRGRRGPELLAPGVVGGALFGLWWRTHDFSYLPPPFVALLAALGLEALRSWLPVSPRASGVVSAGVLALALAAPCLPAAGMQAPVPPPESLGPIATMSDGWASAMAWLRDRTPPPGRPVDAEVSPEELTHPAGSYGVLTPWDYGHQVACEGRRPVLWSGTIAGDEWLLEEDGEEAWRALRVDGGEVRYVVLDARAVAEYFPGKVLALGRSMDEFRRTGEVLVHEGRAYELRTYGERYDRCAGVRLQVHDGAGLGHFRLVYESPEQVFMSYAVRPVGADPTLKILRQSLPVRTLEDLVAFRMVQQSAGPVSTRWGVLYGGEVLSAVKIFEAVPGARVEGRADPGARVLASLLLKATTTGREFAWRQEARADASGRFELTLPYSTDRADREGTTVVPLGRYRVWDGRTNRPLEVSPAQVRTGAAVRLPGEEP